MRLRRVDWFRGFWALVAALIVVFVFYESTRDSGDPAVPEVSTATAYVGHFMLYAALAFSAQTALHARNRASVAIVILIVALYGGLLEAYQSTLPDREASTFDALANLLGAAAGAVLAASVLPRWERWLQDDSRSDRRKTG
jgi:VanZ family protein